MLFEIFLFQ